MKREAGVNGEWIPIPFEMRVKALKPIWSPLIYICLLWFIALLAFIPFKPELWLTIILIAVGGVLIFSLLALLLASPVLLKWRTWKWSEFGEKVIAKEKEIALNKSIQRSITIERYLNHPFSRFLLSIVVLSIAWWVAPTDKPNTNWKDWFFVGVAVAFSIYLLRETLLVLAIVLIVSIGGYLIYEHTAPLSVTSAIIVGAIIIAAAILHIGNRSKTDKD